LKSYGVDMTISTQLGYADLPRLLTIQTGDEKHDWSSHSTLDVLWVLYDRVLTPNDRFLLSKGHGPMAFYAVLAAKGVIPVETLSTFGAFDSPLGHHPDRMLVPGVEISSGSLGHGLGIAVGMALAGRRVYCLVGDGELDEGSNWEAVQYAGRRGLDSLTAIVIDNAVDTRRWPGGVERRFEIEDWHVQRVDGRDHAALTDAFESTGNSDGRPTCVVAEVRP
jgi:transketolase